MGRFLKNTLSTLAARIIYLSLNFAVSIVIARILGPSGKGSFALIMLLPTILTTFLNFGICVSTVYFTSKKKYDLSVIVSNNLLITFIVSIISVLIGLVLIYILNNNYFKSINANYLIIGLLIVPLTFFLQNFGSILQGMESFTQYNIFNIIQNASYFILVLGLLVYPNILMALAAFIVSLLVNCILLYIEIIKPIKIKKLNVDRNYLNDSFKYGIKSYFNNIMTYFNYRADVIIIKYFLNTAAVGYYSISVSFAELMWIISQSASTVIFPRISSLENKDDKNKITNTVARFVLFATLMGVIIMFFASDFIIPFIYSKSFNQSIMPLKIILIGILFFSFARVLSNDLTGRGKPELNIITSSVGLTINIVLNILMIPQYGINGAALSSSISYSIQSILTIIIYCKVSDTNLLKILFIQKSDINLIKSLLKI